MTSPNAEDFIRPMPTSFGKNGFHYEQLRRDGNVAIYQQRLAPGRGCLAFEVVKIRVREASVMFNKPVPAHEYGPSNEDFGSHGWSYPTLSAATAKFDSLRT